MCRFDKHQPKSAGSLVDAITSVQSVRPGTALITRCNVCVRNCTVACETKSTSLCARARVFRVVHGARERTNKRRGIVVDCSLAGLRAVTVITKRDGGWWNQARSRWIGCEGYVSCTSFEVERHVIVLNGYRRHHIARVDFDFDTAILPDQVRQAC